MNSLFKLSSYINTMKRLFRIHTKEIESEQTGRYQKEFENFDIHKHQEDSFSHLGLNRAQGEKTLKVSLESDPLLVPYLEKLEDQTLSEHWLLFAALKESGPSIKRLLEIGTFQGDATRLLARLFPDAEIVTVDLPDDSPIFLSSNGRDRPEFLKSFLQTRQRLLALPNITFIQKNSFVLPSLGLELFDLVWVDAGHDHPEVSWDVCNAWNLCAPGGWLFFDDIYTSPTPSRAWGGTTNSYEALGALAKYDLAKVHLILKRLLPLYSADPHVRKYIGVARKPEEQR